MNKWDERFIIIAYNVASWSKDPNRQVGAVAIPSSGKQISWGYNGPPTGFDYPFEDKFEKNEYTIHAELNCILNSPFNLDGCTMYVTAPPCLSCALAIAQAGITRLVIPEPEEESSWYEHCVKAMNFLVIKKVELNFFSGDGYVP